MSMKILEVARDFIETEHGRVPFPAQSRAFAANVVPPYSVLSARGGEWQNRKRRWLSLGIKSEIGRGEDLTYKPGHSDFGTKVRAAGSCTSLFDPVLCELIYQWFSPYGGQVVDPFAGGSVRGIVAHVLGRRYWGCDLAADQIAANVEQANDICPGSRRVPINVSGPMIRQKFLPCTADYITSVCQGGCGCKGSGSGPAKRHGGVCIVVHPSEQKRIEDFGGVVKDGFLQPDSRGWCPFVGEDGLCRVHFQGKPFGCSLSPFTINGSGTIIIRNRHRLMGCYKGEGSIPAHEAHRWSLEQILGVNEAARVAKEAAAGADKIASTINAHNYQMWLDNEAARYEDRVSRKVAISLDWIVGDSANELHDSPFADFLFSCPPYGDLESYSDDPSDLSNMSSVDFLRAHQKIITLACSRLKKHRFAVWVVGNYRAPDGALYDFAGHTIRAFQSAGLSFYNDSILATAVGSVPLRNPRAFAVSRKMGRVHQQVLVFVKGDPQLATEAIARAEESDAH